MVMDGDLIRSEEVSEGKEANRGPEGKGFKRPTKQHENGEEVVGNACKKSKTLGTPQEGNDSRKTE
jgi:hypothetical protein